jgi:hypothetical protein
LLWEIFSLGQVPYPDVADEIFFQYLKSGHRMEKPELASETLYQIMVLCWKTETHLRPAFQDLENSLNLMSKENVREKLFKRSFLINNCLFFLAS